MAGAKMNMPILRLELEGMKQEMMLALGRYQTQINDAVEEQLENVVQNFDYEKVVKAAASQAITEAIQTYFKYGHGTEIIADTVREALDKILAEKVAKNEP
jgi:hypothetical protein